MTRRKEDEGEEEEDIKRQDSLIINVIVLIHLCLKLYQLITGGTEIGYVQ